MSNVYKTIRCSMGSRDQIFVKGHEFSSFTENMNKNIGKNISKNLSGKYSKSLLDHVKQSATDAIKCFSESNSKNYRGNMKCIIH